MKEPKYLLYRIYDDCGLAYVGKTAQPLNQRLHGHFFAKPMMRKLDPRSVTRIEFAVCGTKADMNLYEIYYIEKLKPPFNFADKDRDELSVALPDLDFTEYDCRLLPKWREAIERKEREEEAQRKKESEIAILKRELRRQYHDGVLTEDEYYDRLDNLN